MTSGYIPAKDEPGPEEILEALRGAVFDNPRLTAIPVEEAASQLVMGGATCRRSHRQRRHKVRSYLAVEVSTLLAPPRGRRS
jgi:hypothetical protein